MFIKVTGSREIPDMLRKSLCTSEEHAGLVRQAYATGKKCQKQAVWIGLER
jgi:hypothetical protein